jgi:hypothetical protein
VRLPALRGFCGKLAPAGARFSASRRLRVPRPRCPPRSGCLRASLLRAAALRSAVALAPRSAPLARPLPRRAGRSVAARRARSCALGAALRGGGAGGSPRLPGRLRAAPLASLGPSGLRPRCAPRLALGRRAAPPPGSGALRRLRAVFGLSALRRLRASPRRPGAGRGRPAGRPLRVSRAPPAGCSAPCGARRGLGYGLRAGCVVPRPLAGGSHPRGPPPRCARLGDSGAFAPSGRAPVRGGVRPVGAGCSARCGGRRGAGMKGGAPSGSRLTSCPHS